MVAPVGKWWSVEGATSYLRRKGHFSAKSAKGNFTCRTCMIKWRQPTKHLTTYKETIFDTFYNRNQYDTSHKINFISILRDLKLNNGAFNNLWFLWPSKIFLFWFWLKIGIWIILFKIRQQHPISHPRQVKSQKSKQKRTVFSLEWHWMYHCLDYFIYSFLTTPNVS
jgi:hypothetical protein